MASVVDFRAPNVSAVERTARQNIESRFESSLAQRRLT